MSKDTHDTELMFAQAKALLQLKANSEKLGSKLTVYMEACRLAKQGNFTSLLVHSQMNACDDARALPLRTCWRAALCLLSWVLS